MEIGDIYNFEEEENTIVSEKEVNRLWKTNIS